MPLPTPRPVTGPATEPRARSTPRRAPVRPAEGSERPVRSIRPGRPDRPLRLVARTEAAPSAPASPAVLIDRCTSDTASPAWSELVDRYGRHLRRGVCRALRRFGQPRRRDRVDDLVQEAYCRLLEDGGRRLRTFRGTVSAQLGAWLGRIAEHTAIDHLRAEAADKRGSDLLVPDLVVGDGPPDPTFSPDRRVEQRERLRHFARRCRALASDEQSARILGLVLVGGWTSLDVARASRGAFNPSRIDTMVYRLRRRLEAEGLRLADRSGRRNDPRGEGAPSGHSSRSNTIQGP